jgi:mannitol-specific phosphotransferase system IIBC component
MAKTAHRRLVDGRPRAGVVQTEFVMAVSIPSSDVRQVIVACEAGMGSSVMVVSSLKKKLKAAGRQLEVAHMPARQVPAGAQVVLVHKGLADTVRRAAPGAVVIAFSQFIGDPAFDGLLADLAAGEVKERR